MQTLNIFRKPSIKAVVEADLYAAERYLVSLAAATEHHNAMHGMQQQRVERLRRQLADMAAQ